MVAFATRSFPGRDVRILYFHRVCRQRPPGFVGSAQVKVLSELICQEGLPVEVSVEG